MPDSPILHARALRAQAAASPEGNGHAAVPWVNAFGAPVPATANGERPDVPSVHGSVAAAPDGWCFGEQSVLDALEALRRGEFILVTDDEDRENEGDLIIAAEKATPQSIAFMVRHTSGVICVSLEESRLEELRLAQMVPNNEDPKRTSFTVSVDYRHGTTTGISAADRSATLRALADPASKPSDFTRPGHIFPLRYATGGVLKRAGHTEASLDFCRLAGLAPVGVLCELVDDADGNTARMPQLQEFARRHRIVMTSIADLVRYRRQREKLVRRVEPQGARMPTKYGAFAAYAYHGGRRAGVGAGAQRVLHRRRVRLAALRLRRPAAVCHGADREGGSGRAAVPARPRGPRHRLVAQDSRLHPAGRRSRHRRGQSGSRTAGGQPRIRHRCTDLGRPGRAQHAPHDQQSAKVHRPRRLPPAHRGARAGARATEPVEHSLPAHQKGQTRPPYRPRG
eukprot:ctg_208.g129